MDLKTAEYSGMISKIFDMGSHWILDCFVYRKTIQLGVIMKLLRCLCELNVHVIFLQFAEKIMEISRSTALNLCISGINLDVMLHLVMCVYGNLTVNCKRISCKEITSA